MKKENREEHKGEWKQDAIANASPLCFVVDSKDLFDKKKNPQFEIECEGNFEK